MRAALALLAATTPAFAAFNLVKDFSGTNFFNGWDFFDGFDNTTNGASALHNEQQCT